MEKSDYIFGIRAVIEAVKSDKIIDKILIKRGLQGELFLELNELIKEFDLNTQTVPEEKLNRITRKNHQGIIAFISPVPFYDLDEIIAQTYEKGKTPLFLYLDQITDVRNFGAIARSAECAAVDCIIIPEKGSAQINGDAIKTSAGALHTIPVCRVKNSVGTIKKMQENGIRIFAATEKANSDYFKSDFNCPCTIVIGSEDQGISPEILRLADELIKIPIKGKIESLNVSVATGILLYEVIRQRS